MSDGNMGKLWGVAVDSKGTWVVADYSKHYIYLLDEQGRLVKQIGDEDSDNGQFKSPSWGIAFDEHDHLYVADFETTTGYKDLIQMGTTCLSLKVGSLVLSRQA